MRRKMMRYTGAARRWPRRLASLRRVHAMSQAKEFLNFLCRIDRAVMQPRDVHLILDNDTLRIKHQKWAWLNDNPSFKLHFTPTTASWMSWINLW